MKKTTNSHSYKRFSYDEDRSSKFKKTAIAYCMDFMTMAAGIFCAALTTLIIGL